MFKIMRKPPLSVGKKDDGGLYYNQVKLPYLNDICNYFPRNRLTLAGKSEL